MTARFLARYLLLVSLLLPAVAGCILVPPPAEPVTATVPAGSRATVTRVIDGDTVDVRFDDGRIERVRYIGIDTPERDDYFYEEATQANADLVADRTIVLVKDVSETDPYGRLLRYIYLPDGTFVNAELVRLGYAQTVTYPPDVAHQTLLTELEREARQAGRGLWEE